MYRWQWATGGQIPSGAVHQGHEATGEPLYVALAGLSGGVHPGKVRQAFGAANIPYGGAEHKVNPYQVLLDAGRWVAAKGGAIPPGAVPAGFEGPADGGETLYVARAHYEGGLHPGKVRPAFGAANIPYGGKEVKVFEYEVLVE